MNPRHVRIAMLVVTTEPLAYGTTDGGDLLTIVAGATCRVAADDDDGTFVLHPLGTDIRVPLVSAAQFAEAS